MPKMTDRLDRRVFRVLQVSNWRQFSEVNLDFHPRLTVITGANASGKSTLLSILARHFNWPRSYSSSPSQEDEHLWSSMATGEAVPDAHSATEVRKIGRLVYGTVVETDITVPVHRTATRTDYALQMPQQQEVHGVFLNSHRQASGGYSQVVSIPTAFSNPDDLLHQYEEVLRNRLSGGYAPKSPQLVFKEAIMAAAVFGGRGNEAITPNSEATAIWEGYQDLLSSVLPSSLGFERLRIRNPDVVIETSTGGFILDDASGGLTALMEMTWQIFLRSRGHSAFCVLLDEPENHLHPSLQREVLPSLLRAFPEVQFIVATHSPFVVTAAPDSHVFVLDYNEEGRIESSHLDTGSKASGADETLQKVLGLPSTMPIWAENAFDEIVDRRLKAGMSAIDLRELRTELQDKGLVSRFPTAVLRIADRDEVSRDH